MSKIKFNAGFHVLFFAVLMISALNNSKAFSMTISGGSPAIEMVTCLGIDGDIKFEIQVDHSRTRYPQGLGMRVSDPNVSLERQEIAFFDARDGLLSTSGSQFVGHVSDGHPLTGRRGERIGGTVLGALSQVKLELDIDFSQAPNPRKRHAAVVTYLKKNGEELVQDLDCRRQK